MREFRAYGSVRGAPSNGCPYRDLVFGRMELYRVPRFNELLLTDNFFIFDNLLLFSANCGRVHVREMSRY